MIKKFLAIQKSKKAKVKKDMDIKKHILEFPLLGILLGFATNPEKNRVDKNIEFNLKDCTGVSTIDEQFQRIESVTFNKTATDDRILEITRDIFLKLDSDSVTFLKKYIFNANT